MTAAVVLLVALVAEDPAVLRNAPRDNAPAQATLWRGDWLEVRGESAGFLKVYDHRHERPGYVRPSQVRIYRVDESDGARAGLGRAVPARRPGLRVAGDRLRGAGAAGRAGRGRHQRAARLDRQHGRPVWRGGPPRGGPTRRTRRWPRTSTSRESYGVKFRVVEPETLGGRARVCYDGEAWAAVLALAGRGAGRAGARGALPGSVDPCRDPAAAAGRGAAVERSPTARARVDRLRGGERASPPRSAGGSGFATPRRWPGGRSTRRGRPTRRGRCARRGGGRARARALRSRGAGARGSRSLRRDRGPRGGLALGDRDAAQGSARERRSSPSRRVRRARPASALNGGAGDKAPLALGERCTYGVVWPSALRWAPSGDVATLAVQPLPAWTELWVLRRAADGSWSLRHAHAATTDPDVGYVESAGFSPDGRPPAGRPRGRAPPATSPAGFRSCSPRPCRSRSGPAAPTSWSPSSAGAHRPGAPARWRCGDRRMGVQVSSGRGRSRGHLR